jgi:hypothetical protein
LWIEIFPAGKTRFSTPSRFSIDISSSRAPNFTNSALAAASFLIFAGNHRHIRRSFLDRGYNDRAVLIRATDCCRGRDQKKAAAATEEASKRIAVRSPRGPSSQVDRSRILHIKAGV